MGEVNQTVANQLATGAPTPLQIGGQTYLVSQPTESDMTAVAMEAMRLLRKRREASIKQTVQDMKGYPWEAVQSVIGMTAPPAIDDVGKLATQHFMEALSDPDGCAFLAWMLCRKEQPSLTVEDFRKHVTESNTSAMLAILLPACGLGRVDPNAPGATGSPSS